MIAERVILSQSKAHDRPRYSVTYSIKEACLRRGKRSAIGSQTHSYSRCADNEILYQEVHGVVGRASAEDADRV